MATTKFLPIICGVTIFLLASLFVTVESSVSRRGLGVTQVAIIAQYLTAHNKVRARHNLPRLKWSNALANYAKWYANQRRGDCKLIHSNLNYGENMFWGKGNRWKPSDAVAGWAIQESYYNYKSNTCMPNKECLHYTQIVWKTTTKVGCAQIRCRTGDTLIVCEYDPHGNVVGQRPY